MPAAWVFTIVESPITGCADGTAAKVAQWSGLRRRRVIPMDHSTISSRTGHPETAWFAKRKPGPFAYSSTRCLAPSVKILVCANRRTLLSSNFEITALPIGTVMSRLARRRRCIGDAWPHERDKTKPGIATVCPAIKLRSSRNRIEDQRKGLRSAARPARRPDHQVHTRCPEESRGNCILDGSGLCLGWFRRLIKRMCLMDQQRARTTRRKLEQCRDCRGQHRSHDSMRFAKLIEELGT